ncbi:MAG: class I SAM-dependent methyltransferase [Bacteroidetes bacterium]|nr:class I SAM-dependent methyltransferase [Bacteroidota bacterium]
MSSEELKSLASDDVQDFIFAHALDDEKKLLLKHKTLFGLPTSLIAQQISARRKAETKLPVFHQTKGVVYPPSLGLEQSSSEATAQFKAEIIQKELGKIKSKAIDLTGGLGIDSFFLSNVVESFDYVEPDVDLLNIVKHNHLLFNKTIQHHNFNAEDYLKLNSNQYDFVYLDPSRRDANARKVFSLADCSPDATTLLPQLFERTDFVLLKASPLLDIKLGLNELKFVKKVFVVSILNEVKELLFFLQKNFIDESIIEIYNLESDSGIKHHFSFTYTDEANTISEFSEPQKFLYEPNASILKSGAFKLIGKRFGLKKLHVNTHLYTSVFLQPNFPGRVFQINQLKFDDKNYPSKRAIVITRNYPLSAEKLKKKLKLSDGGENYVIAFSAQEKKHIVLATRLA